MKCPECVKEGKKSHVYPGITSVTCAGVQTYYDEDGKLHVHDPNVRTTNMDCSEGHKWTEQSRSSCVNCDFGKE